MSEVAEGPEIQVIGRPGTCGVAESGHRLGNEPDDLIGADDAKVIVGQKRQGPPPLAGTAVKDDRPGLGDPERRGGQNPVAGLDLFVRQPFVAEHGHRACLTSSERGGRPEPRGAHAPLEKRCCDGGGELRGSTWRIFALYSATRWMNCSTWSARGARVVFEVFVRHPHHLGGLAVRDVQQRRADAAENLGARRRHDRDLHHSRNVSLATGYTSRIAVHPASGPGRCLM